MILVKNVCYFCIVVLIETDPRAPTNLQTCFGEKLASDASKLWRINLNWNLPEGIIFINIRHFYCIAFIICMHVAIIMYTILVSFVSMCFYHR